MRQILPKNILIAQIALSYIEKMTTLISQQEHLRTVEIAGYQLALDLRYRHESAYYDLIRNQRVDTDSLIFARFLRPGDRVLDAGANIGYTSLKALSYGAAAVYAFEPVPELYHRLAALQDARLHAFDIALSDADGAAEMLLSQTHNQGHTLDARFLEIFPAVFGERPATCIVELATLDRVAEDLHFDFMKIDVEGSELALLRGAKKLLGSHPPRIMVVEIYDHCFAETHQEASKYFKYARRVALEYATNSLKLAPPGDPTILDDQRYQFRPPVYVYGNDESLFE